MLVVVFVVVMVVTTAKLLSSIKSKTEGILVVLKKGNAWIPEHHTFQSMEFDWQIKFKFFFIDIVAL